MSGVSGVSGGGRNGVSGAGCGPSDGVGGSVSSDVSDVSGGVNGDVSDRGSGVSKGGIGGVSDVSAGVSSVIGGVSDSIDGVSKGVSGRVSDGAAAIERLRTLRPAALRELLAGGLPVPDGLLDGAFLGVSLGLPRWVERLAWTTFCKCFLPTPQGTRGWNVRLRQTGLHGPLEPVRRRDGAPLAFGHFRVAPLDARGPARCGPGVLLHYGLGGNALVDPIGRLRDPLVLLPEGLLLGWSYLDFGVAVPTPSFFALRRAGDVEHAARPPRG